jgi:hypothetical protein
MEADSVHCTIWLPRNRAPLSLFVRVCLSWHVALLLDLAAGVGARPPEGHAEPPCLMQQTNVGQSGGPPSCRWDAGYVRSTSKRPPTGIRDM